MARRSSRSSRFGPLLVLLCLTYQEAFCHKQPVHQYLVREGYALLLQKTGHDIPALSASIGLAESSFAGDSAWQKGCVTTGAWREDDEDVVYHYDILPGMNYALTSISHFWDADQGDLVKNMFRLMVERPPLPPVSTDIGPYPNAFDKITKFAHGGWVFWYPRAIICQNTADNHYLVITPLVATAGFGIPLEYVDLAAFYVSHKVKVRSDQLAACAVLDVNDLKTINLSDVLEIKVQDDLRDIVVWEVLGRMCHLLADMSVPAHAHRDEHGLNPDSYEDYVGGTGDPYREWDHTNAGAPILLNGTTDEVLHFLMYIVQQQADHFGSNGPADGNGNDILGGNSTQSEIDFLNAVNLGSLGGPTTDAGPWTVENLNIIRDKTLPAAIRATAGLLYWFCREAGLVESITTVSARDAGQTEPEMIVLMQNYPNPFSTKGGSASGGNPTTTIRYSIGGVVALSGTRLSGVELFESPKGSTLSPPEGRISTNVRLAIYDLLGREVAVLVNDRKAPGSYEIAFDGSGLSSGVYIYRLTAGAYTESRKMLLVR